MILNGDITAFKINKINKNLKNSYENNKSTK